MSTIFLNFAILVDISGHKDGQKGQFVQFQNMEKWTCWDIHTTLRWVSMCKLAEPNLVMMWCTSVHPGTRIYKHILKRGQNKTKVRRSFYIKTTYYSRIRNFRKSAFFINRIRKQNSSRSHILQRIRTFFDRRNFLTHKFNNRSGYLFSELQNP